MYYSDGCGLWTEELYLGRRVVVVVLESRIQFISPCSMRHILDIANCQQVCAIVLLLLACTSRGARSLDVAPRTEICSLRFTIYPFYVRELLGPWNSGPETVGHGGMDLEV